MARSQKATIEEDESASPLFPKPSQDSRSEPVKGERNIAFLSAFAGISGFLFGYDTGVISGSLLFIRDDFPAVDASPFVQETIVSTAIFGAAVGAMGGGWFADRFGRKEALRAADLVFIVGGLAMGLAPHYLVLILGRLLVGLGIGLASSTAPVYIAEVAPPGARGRLVTANVLMITGGQFSSYLVNLAFAGVPGTWRWMLGLSVLPSAVQLAGLERVLPESPAWLVRAGRPHEARAVLETFGASEEEVDATLAAWRHAQGHPGQGGVEENSPSHTVRLGAAPPSHALEHGDVVDGAGGLSQGPCTAHVWDLFRDSRMVRPLVVGVGLQVFQQVAGINTVMYYTPEIIEMAGYSRHATVLALSLLVALMNVVGTLAGMALIDRCGRRRLLMGSLAGVLAALLLLSSAFRLVERDAPGIAGMSASWPPPPPALSGLAGPPASYDRVGDQGARDPASSCPGLTAASSAAASSGSRRTCFDCIRHGCGFCSAAGDARLPGTCLALEERALCGMSAVGHSDENSTNVLLGHGVGNRGQGSAAHGEGEGEEGHAQPVSAWDERSRPKVAWSGAAPRGRGWFTHGCPSEYGYLPLLGLLLYLMSFAPGMGPAPWAVNSEIYPVRYRGAASGVAATANWVANLTVSQTFLSLIHWLGGAATFLVYAACSLLALLFVFCFVPETKDVPLEQVAQLFEGDVWPVCGRRPRLKSWRAAQGSRERG
eukprot:jgi/Mesvir1/28690/Mv11182-RA.1